MRTLVLNTDYTPINIIPWQEAIVKVISKFTAVPVKNYNKVIRDGSGNLYDVPAVIKVKNTVNFFYRMASYSKDNIYARDLEVCQYCGKQVSHKNKTIDHVIPRSKFNPAMHRFKVSSFENVVTCCRPCNVAKGDRTPKQAGMKLLNKPRRISMSDAYYNKLQLGIVSKEWVEYLEYGAS